VPYYLLTVESSHRTGFGLQVKPTVRIKELASRVKDLDVPMPGDKLHRAMTTRYNKLPSPDRGRRSPPHDPLFSRRGGHWPSGAAPGRDIPGRVTRTEPLNRP
jgi:hypothetical protein